MVSTRAQKAKNGNAQPQQPPLPQQHPAPQPAPQQAGGRRKPRKPAKPTKKPAKATKAANDEDKDVVDEVEDVEDELKNVEDRVEDIEDDAPVKFNLGRKRPRSATSEGPSQKARKTGAAGPSNHDATRSGPPTGDAVSSKQAQSRGKGKGKQKEEPAAPNNHFEGSKSQQKFQDARAATLKQWSSRPPVDDSVVWRGGAGLGAGAFGAAWAFYRADGHGIIFDRIAVKDTALRRDHWTDWTRWFGIPWDANNREHMEIKVMKDIVDGAKANRCVILRGSEHYDEFYTYRILMNYCPLGSMHSANPGKPELPAPKKGKKAQNQPLEIYDDGREIPEPLVWKWFEDLAKACVLMEEGIDLPSDSTSRLSGHHVIVHRDIKPANIFLDLPSGEDGDWPDCPVATLGDFGSACYTDENDEHNPMSYNYCEGTPGFRPLELCSMSDPDTKRYKPMGKLGSATNIWSLGASLISICNRESAPTTDFYSLENSIPTFNANAQQVYSQELRDLLDECVRYRGEHRIGPQDLLDSISRHTAGTEAGDGDTDRAGGMRWYTSADDRPSWRLPVKERYRLHMSHDAGEAERVAEEQEDADEDKEQMARQKKKVADAAKAEQAAKVEKAKAKKAAAAEKKKQKKGKK